jgi:hypothetical protein
LEAVLRAVKRSILLLLVMLAAPRSALERTRGMDAQQLVWFCEGLLNLLRAFGSLRRPGENEAVIERGLDMLERMVRDPKRFCFAYRDEFEPGDRAPLCAYGPGRTRASLAARLLRDLALLRPAAATARAPP